MVFRVCVKETFLLMKALVWYYITPNPGKGSLDTKKFNGKVSFIAHSLIWLHSPPDKRCLNMRVPTSVAKKCSELLL